MSALCTDDDIDGLDLVDLSSVVEDGGDFAGISTTVAVPITCLSFLGFSELVLLLLNSGDAVYDLER